MNAAGPSNHSAQYPRYEYGKLEGWIKGLGWCFRVIVCNECPYDLVRFTGPESLGAVIKANSGASGQFIWIPEQNWPAGTFSYYLSKAPRECEIQFSWDQTEPEKSSFMIIGELPGGVTVVKEIRGDCVHFFVTTAEKIEKRRQKLLESGRDLVHHYQYLPAAGDQSNNIYSGQYQ
ncbi:hypothetical protein TWF694_002664 [Orbilia ellipsospora]|uniref:Uncharacterized protein n=1 Tax=Orbilia ellipsospora TaxID=2528407 RepID=A0AAV9X3V5_9PEZI